VALLIALLAWGDQIRQPRKAVIEVEQKFVKILGRTISELGPLIHDSQDFNKVLSSALKLIGSGKLDATKNLIIKKLKELNKIRPDLERKYASRYFLTILLTVTFGLVGLASQFGGTSTLLSIKGITIDFEAAYALLVLAIGGLIVANLISTYFKENTFVATTAEADALIEAE
jgi:hypothetical protein